jgi:hypothetical protein
MQGSAGARDTSIIAPNQLHGGAHTPYPEPTPPSAPVTRAALPVYNPTPRTCSDAIIKDTTYNEEATWTSSLVKFTRLPCSQQWTDDEQHDHFCWSLDGVANDYYTLLIKTSPILGLKDIFGKFEKRFGSSASDIAHQLNFRSTTKVNGKTLRQWADRILLLAVRALPTLADVFIPSQ